MKKNHIALLFLTVVTMVAVWYLKSPLNASTTDNNDNTVLTATFPTRLAELTTMREAVRNERSIAATAYDEVIASVASSISEKKTALVAKQSLSDLTEKEVLTEIEIINLGYQDAFVHSTIEGIEVIIVGTDDSGSDVVDIINMVALRFIDSGTIVVSYKTKDEIKRT